jgi:hypothetical protein
MNKHELPKYASTALAIHVGRKGTPMNSHFLKQEVRMPLELFAINGYGSLFRPEATYCLRKE